MNAGQAVTPAGLTSSEALKRLGKGGPNAIVDVAEHPVRRALAKLWAPIPWMLEAAILLQLVLGDYLEAGVVAFLLIFNAALGFVQEGRAQATLDALKSRLALTASVLRDGHWTMVPAATLVPGDLIKLSLGSVVAADVRLISGSTLLDQSMLTGESLPIAAGAGTGAYAGALVRRGEAVAVVTATGVRTKFGRTAELVQEAKAESSEQKAILRVVRNLALFNGAVTLLLAGYALFLSIQGPDIVSLVLVAVLSAIPVALPSMFTLAAAVSARALALKGVLPTRLSAVDEAASIDVLCSDKTGTLTRNELVVESVHAMPGFDDEHVLAFAGLASSDGGQDPVDGAIRAAAVCRPIADSPALVTFLPFDPAAKRAEATVRLADGSLVHVLKGAFVVIQGLSQSPPIAASAVTELQAKGFRVLAVAVGPPGKLQMAGLIALSDPPREDSKTLIGELSSLGVRTIMVTGDAPATAGVVAKAIGLAGPVWSTTPVPETVKAEDFAIFAGVLPEDKYRLVKALQSGGHIVGMCGDGANDAPALRQAQMGIAVSTATDVAKSAAGIVLTGSGLGGIVASIKEGRATYQRILTYTLRSIVHKVGQVLFLAAGLIITGQAILTPMLMVLMMITGDFLAMASSTDNVRPSSRPSVWKIGRLTMVGICLGLFDLLFGVGSLTIGKVLLHLDIDALRTLAVVTLVFSGQSVLYVVRERRHLWSSWPGKWLMASSTVDLAIVSILAVGGILMAPLPMAVVAGVFGAAVVLALVLDIAKLALFRRFAVA
jgi:H+-transporting ATPase